MALVQREKYIVRGSESWERPRRRTK